MKAFRIICMSAFGVLLVLAAMLFLGPQLPYFGHLEVKIVKSGSMEPKIKTGGIVVLRKAASYNTGDVITFDGTMTQIPTTHRIVGFEELGGVRMIVTKGDANKERDNELASFSRVHGKVLFTIPYVGYVLDFARKPIGFLLLIVLPAFLIIIDEIDKIWKELRRMKKGTVVNTALPPSPLSLALMMREGAVATRVAPVVERRYVDIKRPAPKAPAVVAPVHLKVQHFDQRNVLIASVAVVVLNALIFSSLFVGSTASYFNDVENSLTNTLQASAVAFTVTTNSPAFTIVGGVLQNPSDTVVHTVTPDASSSPLQYSISTEFVSDTSALCNAILAHVGVPFVYDGNILNLNATHIVFSAPWNLTVSLTNGATPSVGDTCSINVIYRARRADVPDNTGYSDEHKIPLTFTIDAPAPQGFARFAAPIIPPTVDIFVSTEGTTTTDTVPPPPPPQEDAKQHTDEKDTNEGTSTEQEHHGVVELLVSGNASSSESETEKPDNQE